MWLIHPLFILFLLFIYFDAVVVAFFPLFILFHSTNATRMQTVPLRSIRCTTTWTNSLSVTQYVCLSKQCSFGGAVWIVNWSQTSKRCEWTTFRTATFDFRRLTLRGECDSSFFSWNSLWNYILFSTVRPVFLLLFFCTFVLLCNSISLELVVVSALLVVYFLFLLWFPQAAVLLFLGIFHAQKQIKLVQSANARRKKTCMVTMSRENWAKKSILLIHSFLRFLCALPTVLS